MRLVMPKPKTFDPLSRWAQYGNTGLLLQPYFFHFVEVSNIKERPDKKRHPAHHSKQRQELEGRKQVIPVRDEPDENGAQRIAQEHHEKLG